MKRQVPVNWHFAEKPPAPPMSTLWNGQQVAKGVAHELRPEGYPKTTKIYCYGCGEYFSSWHLVLWRHGRCKERPGDKNFFARRNATMKKAIPVVQPKKNDKVPVPSDFSSYSKKQMEVWYREHRPENFKAVFGKEL